MTVHFNYFSKQVLSNGELVNQEMGSTIEIYNGVVIINVDLIQYNRTTSIFE